MAETKQEMEERMQAQIDELTAIVQKYQEGEAQAGPVTVITAEGQDQLRKAVEDFREVEKAPASADRLGLLSSAGRTLADRVEGVLG